MLKLIPIGLKGFGSSGIFVYYINYSKSLPKIFLFPTSGIRAHGVVWEGGKVSSFHRQSGDVVLFTIGVGTSASL